MDEAKITVLYDEGAVEGTTYIGGKGLSMLIDAAGERTLLEDGGAIAFDGEVIGSG